MKKTRTIKQEYLVCDITGEELQYSPDGMVGKLRYHLSNEYRWLEEMIAELDKRGLESAADYVFNAAKEHYEQQKDTKTN